MQAESTIASLGRRLRAGERLVGAWSSLATPATTALMLREGFDAVLLDMQHGTHTFSSVEAGISAAALAGAPALVRVPVGDFATASRVLDAGAAGVVAPMISSVAEAEAFAAFVKYPPMGSRSWGPHRAIDLTRLSPPDYLAQANGLHLAMPMLETQAALDAIDDILAVPGIDGVYVGPADLSIALTGGRVDIGADVVQQALTHVAARVKAAGKFAGLFCADGATARAMGERGYAFCTVATDAMLLAAAARRELAAAR